MSLAAPPRTRDRHVRAFHRLIVSGLRLHNTLGWVGLFLLLLLFAANHTNGWVTR